MMPRSRECMVCIGTGYTGRKFGDFFGNGEVGEVCWVYRGPIVKDESDGEMVVWFQ